MDVAKDFARMCVLLRRKLLAVVALSLGVIGAALTVSPSNAFASEVVTLKNGFDVVCDHREIQGDKVKLYLSSGSASFVELRADEIASIAPGLTLPAVPTPVSVLAAKAREEAAAGASSTPAELNEMLAKAGARHHLDAGLLASIVHAESGGNAHAVSRTGARGLMQLMPGTAAGLGVDDSFRPEENIRGGTAYLDALLVKYGDNLALALAAYNAGPAAVARWHGVPPYRETRAYVARVIREFNARRPASAPSQSLTTVAAVHRHVARSMAAGR